MYNHNMLKKWFIRFYLEIDTRAPNPVIYKEYRGWISWKKVEKETFRKRLLLWDGQTYRRQLVICKVVLKTDNGVIVEVV